MKRLKGDLLWGFVLLLWIIMLVVPSLRMTFMAATEAHPYMGGFVKFFILASMGDLLGVRILRGEWLIPKGFFYKAFVWGLLGMMITLVFTVFTGGAAVAQTAGKLPFRGSKLAQAFFGSTLMNLTFGPMMYVYHKFADLYIDMKYEMKNEMKAQPQRSSNSITVRAMVSRIDWYTLVSFSWLKTCIFIWIPCHTAVFLLPPAYRVLASAFLSILLGILVALSKKGEKPVEVPVLQ